MEASAGMTSLICAFARARHAARPAPRVFDDPLAARLLSREEQAAIAGHMAAGIGFFCPGFTGDADAAVDWIVTHQLAPSPLGRAAFAEEALAQAAGRGAEQYLLLGAGLDSFAWRQPDWARGLRIFEVDLPAAREDKLARLKRAGLAMPENVCLLGADLTAPDWPAALTARGFRRQAVTVCSAMGLTYYLPPTALEGLTETLEALLAPGSELLMDYPNRREEARGQRQARLAAGAGEPMQAALTRQEMAALLTERGFRPAEQLEPDGINRRYFAAYNAAHPEAPMAAFENVEYVRAVRR